MRIFIIGAPILVAALLVAGCAPDPRSVEERTAPAAEAAVQVEAATPVAVAPDKQAIPGQQVALLGVVVDVPFEHKQLYDRVRPGPKEVPERQVGLVSARPDHKALAVELEGALKLAGFETRTSENKDDWVWITILADSGHGKVAVRPDGKKPGTVVVFKIPQD